MELLVSHKHCHVALILLCLLLFSCKLGRAQTGYGGSGINGNNIPQTGIAGTGTGYLPQPGAGVTGVNNIPNIGNGGQNVVQIGQRALSCLTNKNVGDFAYKLPPFHIDSPISLLRLSPKLTESGNLNVPHEYTDQYCGGPCLSETHHVLDCINGVLSRFLFFNQATVRAVEETIKEGCSYGPNRGNFNVAEHIEEYNSGYKPSSYLFLLGFAVLITTTFLLF